jgi:Chaperone of endosialidase
MTRLLRSVVVLGALAAVPDALAQVAATTVFTYQGQLKSAGAPANGTYDLLFRVYSAATGGTQIGPTICADNVQVTDGLMTVSLDFGPIAGGDARWLQVAVRADTTVGNCVLGTFTTLSPRQQLTATPYASGLTIPIQESTDYFGSALFMSNDGGTAVEGDSLAPNQPAVMGIHSSPNGTAYGVWGETESTSGTGVYGRALFGTQSRAVMGESSQGFGGYFIGKGYFSDFVGLGTTTPAVPLQVVGGSDLTLTAGGSIVLGQTSGNNLVMDNNEVQARNNGNAANLHINANGGSVGIGTNNEQGFQLAVNGTAAKPGGGSWSTLSDARLKKNVRPIRGALDTLLALRGVTFEYIDPAAINELPGTRTGMVAQDVEAVVPDWVDQGPGGMKRVTYRGFEALTVEAMRDLRTREDDRINALRAEEDRRLAQKDDQIASLQRQLDELRATVARLAGPTAANGEPAPTSKE